MKYVPFGFLLYEYIFRVEMQDLKKDFWSKSHKIKRQTYLNNFVREKKNKAKINVLRYCFFF